MRRFCVAVAVLFAVPVAAGASDTFELRLGESRSLDPYEIEFEETLPTREDPRLLVKKELEGRETIIHITGYEDILDGATRFEADENLSYTVNDFGTEGGSLAVNLTVDTPLDIFSGVDLSSDSPDRVIGRRESTIDFGLGIENSGTRNQTFQLNGSGPQDTSITYGYQGFNVSRLQVPSGEARRLEPSVEIGEDTPVGRHNLTFSAASDGASASKSFTLEVRGEREERSLGVRLEERTQSVRPGDTLRPELDIRNNGEAPLEEVRVEVDTPDNWELQQYGPPGEQNLAAQSLPPDAREFYSTQVEVPEGAEPGDYFVRMTVNSENLESEEKEVRVSVASTSGLSVVGIGILVASLLGMAGTYWKLGRR
nr:MAG: NPCBM-associated, NEW3 domain of alpha-galactosidase [Candidatus Nanosalinarum sp. J07AB56]